MTILSSTEIHLILSVQLGCHTLNPLIIIYHTPNLFLTFAREIKDTQGY